jgi:hypothetical protein
MKIIGKLGLGLALGTLTAAGALLADTQAANAQAPPGFLQLPGTNTSLLVTGQVGTRFIYDSVITGYPGFTESEADALIPILIGVGPQTNGNGTNTHSVSSVHFSSTDANFGLITSTSTAWGPLETVAIFSTGYGNGYVTGPPGNTNFVNSVQTLLAFGTLGPLMVGLNTSLFGDDDANPTSDMMNEPLAVAGVLGELIPGIRYTWKLAGGFSIAGAVENGVSEGVSTWAVGNWDNALWPRSFLYPGGGGIWGPDQVWSTGSMNGEEQVPDFILKARLDQPWGHVALGFMVGEETASCQLNCNPGGVGGPNPTTLGNIPDSSRVDWGFNLTGHVNTWGKDKLMAGLYYGKGLGLMNGEYGAQAGMEVGVNPTDTAYTVTLPTNLGGYVAYKHFWTDQLRSSLAAGYSHLTNESGFYSEVGDHVLANEVINQDIYQDSHWSLVGNVIWSPVNNVDLGAQIIYYHVTTAEAGGLNDGNNNGHDIRIEAGGAIRF